jgi:hypothetical protein
VRVSATNLNGAATAPTASALLLLAGPAPVPVPVPVTGGQVVAVAPGITATLKAPRTVKRGAVRNYAVRFTPLGPRGTVRMAIVNAAGAELAVIAPARPVGPQGKARRYWKMPRTLAPGVYTVRAIYTPLSTQVTAYAQATLSKPIVVR